MLTCDVQQKPTGKNNRSTTISDEKKSEKKQLAKSLRTSNKSSGTERYAAAAAATSRVAAGEGVKKSKIFPSYRCLFSRAIFKAFKYALYVLLSILQKF